MSGKGTFTLMVMQCVFVGMCHDMVRPPSASDMLS